MKNLRYKFEIYKSGFTLAEVLITLVIIGVVAAMTIPNVINNTKKQEYVAGCKKAYSVLSQAVYKIGQNKGYPVGDYSFIKDNGFIDEFANVTSIIKKCDTFSECFGKDNNATADGYKSVSGNILNTPLGDGKSVISADGQMYSFVVTSYYNKYGISDEDAANCLARIFVDINGGKNPNQYGYDAFIFYIVDGKGVIPAGNKSSSCRKGGGDGYDCAAKVLRENAINY